VVDLGNARDIAPGEPIRGFVAVVTDLLSAGATTLQVQVQGSTDNSTFSTYWESEAIAKASVTAAGSRIDFEMPRPTPGRALPRYLRLNYVVAVSNFTAGTITAGLVLGRDDLQSYPPGITVSN
jgi:hypothetical protein